MLLYADVITNSMRRMMTLTQGRRERQERYNREHRITPTSIRRAIQNSLRSYQAAAATVALVVADAGEDYDVIETERRLEAEMLKAAQTLEFERAAQLRDQLLRLRGQEPPVPPQLPGGRRPPKLPYSKGP